MAFSFTSRVKPGQRRAGEGQEQVAGSAGQNRAGVGRTRGRGRRRGRGRGGGGGRGRAGQGRAQGQGTEDRGHRARCRAVQARSPKSQQALKDLFTRLL